MSVAPSKYVQHGRQCVTCHAADGPKTMCRIGRRLYISWFNSQDQDTKMFSLVGMPEEMRKEVLECADVADLGEVSFGDPRNSIPPKSS